MVTYVRKALFRNVWYVYELGHLIGDEIWLASFSNEQSAYKYAMEILGEDSNAKAKRNKDQTT